jgi:hypothetical protein
MPRWKSSATFLEYPLISIAVGPDPANNESRGHARGIIALGDIASGVIAIGGMARGLIAIGGFAIGGLALGYIAAGGCAIGYGAVGGLAIGYFAMGGAAIGKFMVSPFHNDPQVTEFFLKLFGRR